MTSDLPMSAHASDRLVRAGALAAVLSLAAALLLLGLWLHGPAPAAPALADAPPLVTHADLVRIEEQP